MNEPLPKHFNITLEQIENIKRRRNYFNRFEVWIVNIIGWIVVPLFVYFCIYPIFLIYLANFNWLIFIIGISLILLSQYIPSLIFNSIEKQLHYFKSFEEYENAVKLYNQWLWKTEQEWKRTQRDFWHSLNGHEFERETANLYAKFGYSSFVTRGSGDQGIDVVLRKDGKKIIVQCKAHKKPVGPHVIRDLYGTFTNSDADEAILVSLSGWTSGVSKFVTNKPIKLLALEDLLQMQKQLIDKKS